MKEIANRYYLTTYIIRLERLLIVSLHAAMTNSDTTWQDQLSFVFAELNIIGKLCQFSISIWALLIVSLWIRC